MQIFHFDASSLIHAWDEYPSKQFPPLWNWMSAMVTKKEFIISEIAYQEVIQKVPELEKWMKENRIMRILLNNDILQEMRNINDPL